MAKLSASSRQQKQLHGIIGRYALTQHATEFIVDAEVSGAPIIIYGEKGTAKELVAKRYTKSATGKVVLL
jgi:transcriptional regulator with AAA-type ATPase domain